jgi:hypothetical protein
MFNCSESPLGMFEDSDFGKLCSDLDAFAQLQSNDCCALNKIGDRTEIVNFNSSEAKNVGSEKVCKQDKISPTIRKSFGNEEIKENYSEFQSKDGETEEYHEEQNSIKESVIKKSRTKKKSSRKRNFALRADVMNKNIFRAFRRECKSVFKNFLLSNGLNASRGKKIFSSNLKKFSCHLIKNIHSLLKARPEFNPDEFTKFVGIFVNF